MNETDFYPEILHPHDPRFTPLPPPTQDVCEGPVFNVCVNVHWWSHLSGVIARLQYRDAWAGTEDEIDRAVESITKILNVGRPTMGCGCGDSGLPSRINSDGVYQVSYDNGVTWVDAPQFDPRNNVTLLPITVTGTTDEKKCKAANSAVAYFKQMEADTHARKQAGATIAAIAAAAIEFLVIVGIIATGGALAALGGALAAIAANASAGDFDAAFTDAVWADLLCAIYCAFDVDLNISDEKFAQVVSQSKADHPGIAGDYLSSAINMMGSKGLTNATRLGLAGALDCSACPDCDCPNQCDTVWTFYGVHDVVFDGCNTYTMKADGGGAHVAFSSGNIAEGCYCDTHALESWSKWPVGSGSPTSVNSKTTAIWNLDAGDPAAETVFTFTFSSAVIT